MTTPETLLYTAKVRTVGGREGSARSADGRLDVHLSVPGGPGQGTNPEQLFAAGWSACFEGALARAGREMQAPRTEPVIDAEVELNQAGEAFFLRARLAVSLPGIEPELAQRLVDRAHQICPYSIATRGNIDVALRVV